MKYMGSKNRISKFILPIMMQKRKPEQFWVEPFVGGANMIDKVIGPRIGGDTNPYIIALLQYMQRTIPLSFPHIGEQEYKQIQKNKQDTPDWLLGYVGFQLSFGAKFFGGYRRDKAGNRNYQNEAQQNLKAQQKNIIGINFVCTPFHKLLIPEKSLIYCDPPYAGVTSYKTNKFNYVHFWQWCRKMAQEGHTVFVSEYNAPTDFVCIWEKQICSSLTKNTGGKKGIEKLFVHRTQL